MHRALSGGEKTYDEEFVTVSQSISSVQQAAMRLYRTVIELPRLTAGKLGIDLA